MKIVVIGSGIVGITSAWFLQEAGHEVMVVDRQPGPALETSYANGGQVSWGYATPWAAPGLIRRAMGWLFDPDAPLILHPRWDLPMFRFMMRMMRNASPERYSVNKNHLLRLGRYSHDNLVALRELTGIQYDNAATGTLELFRKPTPQSAIDDEISLFENNGIPVRKLDADGCLEVEPGLKKAVDRLAGGIQFPEDELGDCRSFALQLYELLETKGVTFRFNTTVTDLRTERGRVTRLVMTECEDLQPDAVVVAAGSYSPLLLKPLGINVPVYPVKGYSLTTPIIDSSAAPVSTLMDETRKVAITHLGQRLRAAGIAELAGYDRSLDSRHYNVVLRAVQQLFPDAADYSNLEWWCGLRPMTPEGPPLIGKTPIENLFLNTGQGTLGWTLSCGSAHLLADIISGATPEIDTTGLTLDRYT